MSWVALALASAAAALLWIANAVWYGVPSSGGPGLSLLFIGGWALLAWAVLLAVGLVVHLVISAVNQRGRHPLEFGVLAATILIIAGTILAHPLSGSASA
ncbi:hypothetical protein [Microbacterium sp. P03]|uniref:hypothetical protein n=1 Tax=Microbacterium sp. P03 TaxID=3366946 RepID=UPI00374575F7